MERTEKVIITNMCMVYDDEGNILVQDRVNPNWPGITFPGGHVEPKESFVNSVIREVKEETGLDIEQCKVCGFKQFTNKDGEYRYIVIFFKTNTFKGKLRSSNEGKVFWIKRDEIENYKLADGFIDMMKIFEEENLNEIYYENKNNDWITHLL
ncbi:8-oxo-dGTP diphosphatase [Haploplasma axanthum]|uniref:Nucleoside triphosphatase YtkD n=1 Tax=Haploplasma axanthum TaxID=29552 RepID=A0A449BBZ7_HAPAX|nr:8-oxo-dGTP diphosphatase [Haploplasma axanthum]VEU79952.1 nucleoside triphosphatase YtkD [Haploplasma axanthum]